MTSGSEALPRKSSGNEDKYERKWKLFNTINEAMNTYSGQSDMIQIVPVSRAPRTREVKLTQSQKPSHLPMPLHLGKKSKDSGHLPIGLVWLGRLHQRYAGSERRLLAAT